MSPYKWSSSLCDNNQSCSFRLRLVDKACDSRSKASVYSMWNPTTRSNEGVAITTDAIKFRISSCSIPAALYKAKTSPMWSSRTIRASADRSRSVLRRCLSRILIRIESLSCWSVKTMILRYNRTVDALSHARLVKAKLHRSFT